MAPGRPCRNAVKGCPAITHDSRGYCPTCAPIEDARRGSSAARGYGHAWRTRRLRILKRDKYLCQACRRNGVLNPVGKSGHVDHVVPRARGGTDDDSNLQTLCASCHSAKTATEDGGFGR